MFDPYHKWLGIAAKDQPPNHYRLLAVELFETDLDVIEGAADRQMAFIRQYQSGEHAGAAAKILNELANARLCLLKPATKAAYDEKLRAALVPQELDFQQLPYSIEEPVDKRVAQKRIDRPTKVKSSGLPLPLLAAGGAAVAVLVMAVGFMISGRLKPPSGEKARKQESIAIAESAKPIIDTAKPSVKPHKPTNDSKDLWTDSKLVTEPAGPPVDLLKLVDVSREVTAGEWKQASNSSLIGNPNSRLFLPVKPPEDYQLKFSVRRLEGANDLIFGFIMSGWQGMIVLDG